MVEEFKIWFYDPCVDNALSISTQLEDVTYEVGTTYATYTPSISTSETTTTCPLTASCWIYSDDQDEWIDCDNTPSGPWDEKDAYASRFFSSFTTANTGAYQIRYTIGDYTTDISAPYPNLEYLVKIRLEDPRSINPANYVEDTFTLTIEFKCAHDLITYDSSTHSNYGHQQLIIDYTTNV